MADSLEKAEAVIEELVMSGQSTLDSNKIKNLKSLCKHSNATLQHVFTLLMTQLEKNHREIRYSTFQIICQLFERSHMFRQLILVDFQIYMDLTMDLDFANPLPPPKHVADKLKSEALKAMCAWFKKFGPAYGQLRVAFQFLKTVKKIKFDSQNPQSQLTFLVSEEREDRLRKFNKKRIDKLTKQIDTDFEEIKNCTKEINSCLKLLVPDLTDTFVKESSSSKTDMIVAGSSKQREAGVLTPGYNVDLNLSLNSSVKVTPNEDKKALIKQLIDSVKIPRKVHLQCLKSWLSTACKYGGPPSLVKRLSDAKCALNKSLEKFDDLEITLEDDEDEDCDDFEDVNEEGTSTSENSETNLKRTNGPHEIASSSKQSTSDVPPFKKAKHNLTKNSSTCSKGKVDTDAWKPMQSSINDPTSYSHSIKKLREKKKDNGVCSVNSSRKVISTNGKVKLKKILPSDLKKKATTSKLKSVAPVVSFGTDLLQWDQSKLKELKETMTLGSAKELGISHRFYGESSSSAGTDGVSDSAIDHLTSRTIEFSGEFEKVTHTCRAPLPNGKLCPRQDRFKCPFHGKIIERDAVGNPRRPYEVDKNTLVARNNSKEEESYMKDLEMNLGGKFKLTKKRKKSSKPENGLTDLAAPTNNSRYRLFKKINKSMRRVHDAMDRIDDRRNLDKFGNNFNYALK
jgi:hypothetical protein